MTVFDGGGSHAHVSPAVGVLRQHHDAGLPLSQAGKIGREVGVTRLPPGLAPTGAQQRLSREVGVRRGLPGAPEQGSRVQGGEVGITRDIPGLPLPGTQTVSASVGIIRP